MAVKKTHKQYIQELVNKNVNAYPIEEYKGSNTKILHECKVGHQWQAYPTNLLTGRSKGCPTCSKQKHKTHDEYEQELFEKEIDYWPLEKYINAHSPILHECLKGHRWKAQPGHILKGHGCPTCADFGFKLDKPAKLYYVKISKDNEIYYKIGITSQSISSRLRGNGDKEIKVLSVTEFQNGKDALKKEQEILNLYPRVSVKDFIKTGHTELFEYDVLELDRETVHGKREQ